MLNNIAGANMPANLFTQNNQNNPGLGLAPAGVQRQVENQTAAGVRRKDAHELGDCYTCNNRRYRDVSDDPGVSFQTPTRLSPAQAAIQVPNHEREHFMREEASARRENREVLSNQIRIFHDTCPECGRTYVSGGETRTVTRTGRDSGHGEGEHGASVLRGQDQDPNISALIGGGRFDGRV